MAEAETFGTAIGADETEEESAEGGSVDAAGVALALDAAHHDPLVEPAAREYLNRLRVLVDLQIKHFDEEHTLAIVAARRKGFIDRLRICLQVLLAAIIGGVIIAIVMMLWDAVTDRGVVIDAISVPEDLAQRGFTGEVVAERILDRLAEINDTSGTIRAANSYSNSLGGGIKLEIPETGISVGELSRTLHEKLGHATHVGGEITHSGENVTVRLRLGDEYEVESVGPEATLPALVQDASTKIYARTQPYRYGYWLYTMKDLDAGAATFRQLAATGPRTERVWALHGLAIVAKSPREAIRFDREALQIDPTFFLSHETIAQEESLVGHDEAALKEFEALIASGARSNSGLSRNGEAGLRAQATLNRDAILGDYLNMAATAPILAEAAENDTRRILALRSEAHALILLHDFAAAGDIIERVPPPESPLDEADIAYLKATYAAQSGDWQSATAELEHIRTLMPTLDPRSIQGLQTDVYPLLAESYARLGRDADAATTIGLLANDVYGGWCARGRIATLHHDYLAGERAFAEAARQAPSIPRADFDWGDMLAAKGDLSGAIAKYTEANRLGPHWADPLKAWGDVLARQGKARAALGKYRQALVHAPHWMAVQALIAKNDRT